MKRLSFTLIAILAAAALASAQDAMMQAKPATGQGAESMMAPKAMAPSTTMMADSAKTDPMSLRNDKGSGGKVIYSDLMAAQKLAAKGPTVLFFAADWCPTCQAALKDINANGGMLKGTTVVVVDYDKAGDLKTRYGITAQHSFVQIDASGKPLAVWNGGGVAEILDHVKRGMM